MTRRAKYVSHRSLLAHTLPLRDKVWYPSLVYGVEWHSNRPSKQTITMTQPTKTTLESDAPSRPLPAALPVIKLVCFDLGGVMIRIAKNWDHALQRAGLDDEVTAREGFSQDPGFQKACLQFEVGQIGEQQFTSDMANATGLADDQVLAIVDGYLADPYPGFEALVDHLRQTAVQTACLSNTNPRHWRAMSTPGDRCLPLDRLDYRFASQLIGHRKPEPAVYRHVQRQTHVDPSAILFFDDHHTHCLAAAKLGWNAYRIDPEGDPLIQVNHHLRRYKVFY